MNKKLNILSIIILAVSAAFLVSCDASQDFNDEQGNDNAMPIAFSVGTAATTRAVGLETLVKDIRVYGTKGTEKSATPSTADTRVFDNYVLWYDQTDKGLTSTNTNEWEYVGSYVGSISDGTMSDMSSTANQTSINAQRTKYWDHKALFYYFWAIAKASQGSFTTDTYGRISSFSKAINYNDLSDATKVLYYTAPIYVPRDGDADEDNLGSYGKVVNLVFNRMMSRVRLGFYSDVSGWKVTAIHFYTDDSTVATDNTLYINGGIVTSATANITYGYTAPTKPTATYSLATGATTDNPFSGFGTLSFDNSLSTNSNAPTYDSKGYVAMIPTGTRAGDLTLKCDYTLSSDDTDETIKITGASVTIPATECSWQPNYAYTYIFKLTNGALKPITLDALYAVSETSGTTTTIEDKTLYTITTYQEGSVTDSGITYTTGKTIDVTVSYSSDKSLVNTLTNTNLTLSSKPTDSSATLTVSSNKATFTPDKAGTYIVTFTYKDADSNDATVQKVITVE